MSACSSSLSEPGRALNLRSPCDREPSTEHFMSLTRCCGGSRPVNCKDSQNYSLLRCLHCIKATMDFVWVCVCFFLEMDKIDDKCGAVFNMSHIRWLISERINRLTCISYAGFYETALFAHSFVGLNVSWSTTAVSKWPVCHTGLLMDCIYGTLHTLHCTFTHSHSPQTLLTDSLTVCHILI